MKNNAYQHAVSDYSTVLSINPEVCQMYFKELFLTYFVKDVTSLYNRGMANEKLGAMEEVFFTLIDFSLFLKVYCRRLKITLEFLNWSRTMFQLHMPELPVIINKEDSPEQLKTTIWL